MASKLVIITEVIEHSIEIDTKKDWRDAEEIALDYLSLLQGTDEAAETLKQIVSHSFETQLSLHRMQESCTVDIFEETAKANVGHRIDRKNG